MPREKRFIAFMVSFSFLFTSCAASIKREGYLLDPSTVNQMDCTNTMVVKRLDYAPELVELLGNISAADSGFSVDCSETLVIDSFKKDACAIGADIVNITKDSQPDFWSTCYRAEATSAACRPPSVISLTASSLNCLSYFLRPPKVLRLYST